MNRKACVFFYLFLCIVPNLIYFIVYTIAPKYTILILAGGVICNIVAWVIACFYFGMAFLYRSCMVFAWIMDSKGKRPEPLSAVVPKDDMPITNEILKKRQQFWRGITFTLCIVPLLLIVVAKEVYPDYWGAINILLSCFSIAYLISHTKIAD